MSNDLVVFGVHNENVSRGFASDVKEFSIRADGHAFRLAADPDDVFDFSAGDVEHAGSADVFVGNVKAPAVGAESKLFGIRADQNFAQEFFLRDIYDSNAVGGFVRLRIIVIVVLAFLKNRIAIGIQLRRRGNGRAAYSHVNRFAVGTD